MRAIDKIAKGLILVTLFSLSTSVLAQKYWVGGEGKWSDASHWSNTSGGVGGASVPTTNDKVFFDLNSKLASNSQIKIDTIAFASSLDFTQLTDPVNLVGDSSSSIVVTGRIEMNKILTNHFNGTVCMTGGSSDYKHQKFDPGEFYGLKSLNHVYDVKNTSLQTLAVTSVDTSISNATCGANGSITLNCNDGSGSFVYDWYPKPLNGDGSNTITDLSPGRYTCVIYDLADGIPIIISDLLVDGPSPLTISLVPPVDSVSCFGESDGGLTALVFGGVRPYQYSWNDDSAQAKMTSIFIPPNFQRVSVSGLPTGDYQLRITDDVGCTENGPVWQIKEPTALTTSIVSVQNAVCFSGCTGSAVIEASGGTPTYSYDWYDDPGGNNTESVNNLCEGNYHVEVTDAKGCADTVEVTISEPAELDANVNLFTNDRCFNAGEGTATVEVVGGHYPYSFNWYNKTPVSTDSISTGFTSGTYNVEVVDSKGCLDTVEVIIGGPDKLVAKIIDVDQIACFGESNGEAEAFADGGTPNYKYKWYNLLNNTTSRVTNLSDGTYFVRVEDDNGCLDTTQINIFSPALPLTTTISDSNNVSCFGECNANATVTPSGGTAGYTYDWYDASVTNKTDSIILNLCEGTYNVRVTDANGCTAESSVELSEPEVLTATTSLSMLNCNNQCIGAVDLTPEGGTEPYQYDWWDVLGTPTSQDLFNLCADTFHVEIKDANLCLDTISVIITEPDTLIGSVLNSTSIFCKGDQTGSIEVTQTGGIPPFEYKWYDAPTDPSSFSINNLFAGIYNVEIKDDNDCVDTVQIDLNEPVAPLLVSIIGKVNVECKNACSGEAEVQATGGAGDYDYDWYDIINRPTTKRVIDLCAGTYHVEVSDKNGCKDTVEFTITEPSDGVTIDITDSVSSQCGGSCAGKAFAVYSGGEGDLTVDWFTSGNQSSDTAYNMCPGINYVMVSDINGCTGIDSVFIDAPDPVSVVVDSMNNPKCFQECNGSISVSATGGVPDYIFDWYEIPGGFAGQSLNSLCAGTYNVRVEDKDGCSDTATLNLINPDPLFVSIKNDTVHTDCFGSCNGVAKGNGVGGDQPYTFSWYDAPTPTLGDSVTGLCAGLYHVELEDLSGCKDTTQFAIREPSKLVGSTSKKEPSCLGVCDGSASVSYSGGTAPYSLNWYNLSNQITDTVENLCVGNFSVEVVDSLGCRDTSEIIISAPIVVTSSITDTTHVVCYNSCNGSATVTPSGGLPPYSFNWFTNSGLISDSLINNICAGFHQVEVVDDNGCRDTSEVTIRSQSTQMFGDMDFIPVSCYGESNGSAFIVVSGGVPNYKLDWLNAGNLDQDTVSSLPADVYEVEVEDNLGCLDTFEVEITEPDSLNTIIFSKEDVVCFGQNTGNIIVDPEGGTPNYIYNWYDAPSGGSDSIINDLPAGTYNIELVDKNGCVDTTNIVINQPSDLILNKESTKAACSGVCTGSAIIKPTGGTSPYYFDWFEQGNFDQDTLRSLCSGFYKVEVTDDKGCIDTITIEVTELVTLTALAVDSSSTTCYNGTDGWAAIGGSGGTLPYDFWWNDDLNQATDTAFGLSSGSYKAAVIDFNGCSDTIQINVEQPSEWSHLIDSASLSCFELCDGQISITPDGGTGPYQHSWNNGSKQSSVTNLCAGVYTDTITDLLGCKDTVSTDISQPNPLELDINTTRNATCFAENNASITVVTTGGTAPYRYLWNSGENTQIISGKGPSTYIVTVTDTMNCSNDTSITIIGSPLLTSSITDTIHLLCGGIPTGSATVTPAGGVSPYSFDWYDAPGVQIDSIAINLSAGTYNVEVTDSNGCSDTSQITINQPIPFSASITDSTVSSCNVCDGTATVTPLGGVGAYEYDWFDAPIAQTDSIATGLCSSLYKVKVSEENGCVDTVSVLIPEPEGINASIEDSSNVVCYEGTDGWAFVSFTGGTAPFTILWDDVRSQSTDTATGLAAGIYNVTITDSLGCVGEASVIIEEPDSITVGTSNIKSLLCTGFCVGEATLTASGGTAQSGYSYLWEDGQTTPTAVGLCHGYQTYTVIDGVGCTFTDSLQILDQNQLTSDLTGTQASCNVGCDGIILSTPSGGTPPYRHSWNTGATTENISSLCPAVYIDTIYDDNGCFLIDSFRINDPSLFSVEVIDSKNVSCHGVCDGIAIASANGGIGPFTFSWYNAPGSQVNDTVYNLCAATYYVRGEDASGCLAEDTITLTQPSQILVSLDASNPVTCFDKCDGSALVSAVGGKGTLSYLWEDASTSVSRTGLCSGNYTVYAIDDSSCIDSVEFTVGSPDSLQAVITDTNHIVCTSFCIGDATVGEIGGTSPYDYNWYDVIGTPTSGKITGQCAGNYHVEVTDANGCKDTAVAIINDKGVLSSTIETTHISCFGECDGKLVAQPTGGITPYTYQWNSGSTLDSIQDLCQGNYFITITDFDGCQVSVAASIVEPALLSASIIDSANLDCSALCDGFATVSPSGGTSPYEYLWNDPSAQTGITATSLCGETYKVILSDSRGCIDSTEVFLNEPDSIELAININQANCNNIADGSIDITVTGGVGSYSYSWIGPDGYASSSEDLSDLSIGTYEVLILDSNGCSVKDSAAIMELNSVNAYAGVDTSLCENDSIMLMGSGGVLYSWSDGGTTANHMVSPNSTTEYILSVVNNGCYDTDTVLVTVNEIPNITASADDYLILENSTVQLDALGAGTGGIYDWSPPLGLNDPTLQNPQAVVLDSIEYNVIGTDINGCSNIATIKIDVVNTVIFADGITPNGDGKNEVWTIKFLEEFPKAKVMIFNRWGQKVYESSGYSDFWDGTRKGKKLPIGTYYYVIDLGPGFDLFTGPITLMR